MPLKNLTKKILNSLGYKLIKTKNLPTIFDNIFKKKYPKKVLISFVQQPFISGINHHHSCFLECHTAAEIFDNLGYQVDVVDYNSENSYNLEKYEIIYGFGEPMESSFRFPSQKYIPKITYLNGCNPTYSNLVSTLRTKNFYQTKNFLIPSSSRIIKKAWRLQTLLSDVLIVLGNSFVANTYLQEDKELKVHNINAFFFDAFDIDLTQKNYSIAKKYFLWFGSSGAIHKGLDLLIDIFAKRDDITLHICGLSSRETMFLDFYGETIEKCPNIINNGFIDIYSSEFKELMLLCGAVIFPSVSEGGGVSVLNVLANGGLIPIISKSTGLDLEDYGIVFDEVSIQNIEKSIDKFLNFTELNIEILSTRVKNHVRDEYSYSKYKENLKAIIKNTISTAQSTQL